MTKISQETFQSHSWDFPLYDWKTMKAPEVLQILSDKCRRMHLSYATEKSYAGWAQSYIRVLPKYPTAWMSEKKAETCWRAG